MDKKYSRICPLKLSLNYAQAENSTFFIIREIGPTNFLLAENEHNNITYKVSIGNKHSCSCKYLKSNKMLCIHLCWLFMKKFKVSKENEVFWKAGLTDGEIGDLLLGKFDDIPKKKINNEIKKIDIKDLEIDDSCPICQEIIYKSKMILTYCSQGCGKQIHIKCMQIWAKHQKKRGITDITCPICRHKFGAIRPIEFKMPISGIRTTNHHTNFECKNCSQSPIIGKLFKCINCPSTTFCKNCFMTQLPKFPCNEHIFYFKMEKYETWRQLKRKTPEKPTSKLHNKTINDQIPLNFCITGSSCVSSKNK
ncbi:hypothetical protein A3Q56_00209 [Intoshia linei]|uniref:SWIM-type domain-containing protein n=1 Tax=Intoshia linei TaxID=1819745 RepID=A0A177BCI9_9BILA|nr:hypothetical protein A3Q56_00209 [Intoshia linei]